MTYPSTLAAVLAIFAARAGGPCGPVDNFFATGGDSFEAAVCVHALRREGFNVTLKDLFECKTAARLAARIDGRDVA